MGTQVTLGPLGATAHGEQLFAPFSLRC